MEPTIPTTTPPIKDDKKSGSGLKIGLIIMSILTVCGIGFGIYELLNNNNKTEQIKELQVKIDQLEKQATTDPTGIMVLSITKSSWSGWFEDYEPEEQTLEYLIKPNETYDIGSAIGYQFSFKITEINENSITIHTTKPFSDSEKGVNLSTDKQDFIIEMGKSIELTTPTMDAGGIYILKLLRNKC